MDWSVVHDNMKSLHFRKLVHDIRCVINKLYIMTRCSTCRNGSSILKWFSFDRLYNFSFFFLRFLGFLMLKLNTPKAKIALVTVCRLAFDKGASLIADEPRLNQPQLWRMLIPNPNLPRNTQFFRKFISFFDYSSTHTARTWRVFLRFLY